jgi:biopolymer transport protein ExbD
MQGQATKPLKLYLPKDEPDSSNAISDFSKESRLTVLFSIDKHLYVYSGSNIRNGKKYTFEELKDTLKARRSDKTFSVTIKPTKNSTYSSTINILDAMTMANIEHYALVDVTKEEESYFNQISW